VIGEQANQPIYLKQVAAGNRCRPEITINVCAKLGFGQASAKNGRNFHRNLRFTLSIAKRKGADAMKIADVMFR